MATRSDKDLDDVTIKTRTVKTGQTVTVGAVVKDGDADGECQPCTDGVGAIGIVTELGKLDGAAGDKVSVAMLGGGGVVPVKVGTGGATRGKFAKCVATGVTDAAPAGAGSTAVTTVGYFTQSGVAGDFVGLVPVIGWITA